MHGSEFIPRLLGGYLGLFRLKTLQTRYLDWDLLKCQEEKELKALFIGWFLHRTLTIDCHDFSHTTPTIKLVTSYVMDEIVVLSM